MCSCLAEALGQQAAKESYFTIGLFSALDAMLDLPLEEIVASLPLQEDVSAALLSHEGIMGCTLRGVLAYERAEWEQVAAAIPLEEAQISEAYLEAVRWSIETSKTLQ
jgi:EAL and modified HD-GYP domain-containing signal transduction protein